MVDLAKINMDRMRTEGIKEEQIFWVSICTYCHNDLFFSRRKEGRTGGQLYFIELKS
jgi:copper oxidase (laccase) domain-containing protein